MLSTPIGKGYIILINDKSLWGKYVLRNADFRFSAQIRSHFLLHQEANHHRYFEGYPYFSPALHWHTNCNISWDIPTFRCPSTGTLIMTSLGISHLSCSLSTVTQIMTPLGISLLFRYPLIVTQMMTYLGISQHFRPHRLATNMDIFRHTQLDMFI